MRKADIRRGHKGNERISDMLEELHRTLFAIDDRSWPGKTAPLRFSLISSSRDEAEDTDGADAGWIEWEFTPAARKLIQESESYAVRTRSTERRGGKEWVWTCSCGWVTYHEKQT